MAFNPNKSPNPSNRHRQGLSSSNSGVQSHYFMSTEENGDENRRRYGYDSSAPMDYVNSENRRVLTERNLNCFTVPKERKSSLNSEIDFGTALFGDSPKMSRTQSEDKTECKCELGSIFRSNSNTNNSAENRGFRSPERGRSRSSFTQIGNFDSEFEFKSETGETREFDFRPLPRVSSVGNLVEREPKFEFRSGQRRSASPNFRTSSNHEIEFNSPSFRSQSRRKPNEFRCNCELDSYSRDFEMDQSPIYDPKTNYLSPKPPFLRSRSKSQFRNSPFSSQYLHEKSNTDFSLSRKPEKVRSETERQIKSKSNFCLSRVIKLSILFGLFFFGFLFVKEVRFLNTNLGSNMFFRKNLNDLVLKPEYFGDFSKFNEEYENRELNLDQVIEISEPSQNLEEKIEIEVENLVLNDSILIEEENLTESEEIEKDNEKQTLTEEENLTEFKEIEKDNEKEILIEEITKYEEIQAKLDEKEISSEKTEVLTEFEKPIYGTNSEVNLIDSCVVSVPIKTGTIEEETNKDVLRIRFSVAFIYVAISASLISCFYKREQFIEILKRNYNDNSSKNEKKSSRKRLRDEKILSSEESYGSFLTYEKIQVKKRLGEQEGLMTPVRRSSRIRNHLSSPS